MNLSLSTCFVFVNDPDEALTFYRDVLGLDLRNDVSNRKFRWLTVGASSQPDVDIVLSNYLEGSPSDVQTVSALAAKGGLNAVHFRTPDLDAVFQSVKDAGGEVVSEPADQPWGVRDCAFRDPSGNLVRVSQA